MPGSDPCPETVPDTNQMTLGRLAIDEGADLVCGHHPHVLQGIETYKGKNICAKCLKELKERA